jgi:hypothetical protein
MSLTITVTNLAQLAALRRAAEAYSNSSANMGGAALDEAGLLQSVVDRQLEAFVERYLVRVITRLAFLNRFTADERIAIRAAAAQSPAIADYLAMLDAAQDVDLTDARTIGGANALEAAGLIGEGRAAEILAL